MSILIYENCRDQKIQRKKDQVITCNLQHIISTMVYDRDNLTHPVKLSRSGSSLHSSTKRVNKKLHLNVTLVRKRLKFSFISALRHSLNTIYWLALFRTFSQAAAHSSELRLSLSIFITLQRPQKETKWKMGKIYVSAPTTRDVVAKWVAHIIYVRDQRRRLTLTISFCFFMHTKCIEFKEFFPPHKTCEMFFHCD